MAGYSQDNPLKFEIRYTAGDNNKKMALAAASLWKQVLGVQATLLNEEYKVFLQNRERRILTQVFQAGWISDYADAYSFLNLFRSGHGRNDYGYSNNLYDALLDEVAAERIPSIRRRLMFETERLLLADVPFIPLYTYVTKRMVNPRLKGWQSNVMDHHYSKDMYFLKASSDEAPARDEKTGVMEAETPDVSDEDALNETPPAENTSSEPEPVEAETDNETPPEDTPE
jgi:oligopeptide transport system substrate-binding protein